jgi:hypothetical protein
MSLRLSVLLNNSRQDKVLARQGFNPSKPGERESYASPIYRTLDRAFEMLDAERRGLNKKFFLNEWCFLFDVLKDCKNVWDVPICIDDSVLYSCKADEYQLNLEDSITNLNLSNLPSFSRCADHAKFWATLDVVERFHAAGDIEASAEGLKKLGILCREEV